MDIGERGNKAWSLFRDYIVSNGKRKTPEREMIVRTMAEFRSHFSMEELYKLMTEKNMNITIATAYNTVNELEAAGLLRKLYVNKAALYELVPLSRGEYHLVCTTCGKISEFSDAELESVLNAYRPKRFNVSAVSLLFQGTCSTCQAKKKK